MYHFVSGTVIVTSLPVTGSRIVTVIAASSVMFLVYIGIRLRQ